MKMDLLQKYLFIPLDIFKKKHQNKIITSKLDAWLAFLCMDDPDDIIRLIEAYPEFRPIYQEAYEICRSMEDIMGIFSEELLELDRNTVQLMIDEMQDRLDDMNRQYGEMKDRYGEIKDKYGEMKDRYGEMKDRYGEMKDRYGEMEGKYEEMEGKYEEIEKKYQEALVQIQELQAAAHQENPDK